MVKKYVRRVSGRLKLVKSHKRGKARHGLKIKNRRRN